MPVDFEVQRVNFSFATGGPRSTITELSFPSKVDKAQCVINGYQLMFNGEDRKICESLANAEILYVSEKKVGVRTHIGLRDASGNYDDAYGGFVEVLVIVNRA